jgi:hypothetical protein
MLIIRYRYEMSEIYSKNFSLANIQKLDPEIRLYFPVKYQ